ncbi:DC-STAMP domain-containing protein 2-like [Asterias rubens]|uniref:DC-STAMP domain-containing protein 2-like n=1 Tax=Asterias rubens TaxID=7604 RepID=UPI001455B66E|nr:DC-STAMP domain-containing protein 2-like [Asterias rubens]
MMLQQVAKSQGQKVAQQQIKKQVQKKVQEKIKEKVQEKVEEKVREKILEEVAKQTKKQVDQFKLEGRHLDTAEPKEKPKKRQKKVNIPKPKPAIPGKAQYDMAMSVKKQVDVDMDRVQELLAQKRLEEDNPKLKKKHKRMNKKRTRMEKKRKKRQMLTGGGPPIDVKMLLELEDMEEEVAEDLFQQEKRKALQSTEDETSEDIDDGAGGKKKLRDGEKPTPLRSALFSLILSVRNFYHYLGTFLPCFMSGTYANKITKSVMGFLVGLVLVFFFYFVFVFGLKQDPSNAAFTATCIGPVICFGMAFSRQFSCMMLLMIPQLFSGKGRTILMAYVFLLVITGPLENLTHNIDVAGQSQVCGIELALNQSNTVFQLATAPLAPFMDGFKSLFGKLNSLLSRVKSGFNVMTRATRATGNAIQLVYDWIAGIVTRCNYFMMRPAEKCRDLLTVVAAKCRRKLGIFQFLCKIVDIAKNVCSVAEVLDLLCELPRMMGTAIKKCGDGKKETVVAAFNKVQQKLYVKLSVSHDLTFDAEFSTTLKQIRDNMRGEVEDRLRTFTLVLNWLNRVLSFTFLLLLFRAYRYHHRYLTKDKHDNWYITEHFEEVDEIRVNMGKSGLLPLNLKERWTFIKPDSIRLAKPEKRRFLLSITLWITEVCYATMVIVSDYAAYWFLDMVRLHSEINVFANSPGAVTIHVEGQGILADIYRALVESLDPQYIHDIEFDTTKCLPQATLPDTELVYMITAIFIVCLFMVIFEAYGLRLRRYIMSKHYPERERVRAVWLYNHILRRRGGFKKFLSKNKKKDGQGDADDGVNFFSQLASRSKIAAMLLKVVGCKWKFCSNCGVPGKFSDRVGFVLCDNFKCPGIYCLQCVSAINNLCHLCSQPVDCSLIKDDFDFELGSSDDDSSTKDDEEKLLLPVSDRSEVLDYSYQYKIPQDQDDEEEEESVDESSDEEDGGGAMWGKKEKTSHKNATGPRL